MTSLSDRAQSFPEPWKPVAGDVIEGIVTELSTRSSEYGSDYTIITAEDDAGTEHAIHCFHSMLRNEVERKTPAVGDRIAVCYFGLGEASAPGMSPPHRYRLVVERGSAYVPPVEETRVEEGFGDDIPF